MFSENIIKHHESIINTVGYDHLDNLSLSELITEIPNITTEILDYHLIIRKICGYDYIKKIDNVNLITIMDFLKIAYNYIIIKKLENDYK